MMLTLSKLSDHVANGAWVSFRFQLAMLPNEYRLLYGSWFYFSVTCSYLQWEDFTIASGVVANLNPDCLLHWLLRISWQTFMARRIHMISTGESPMSLTDYLLVSPVGRVTLPCAHNVRAVSASGHSISPMVTLLEYRLPSAVKPRDEQGRGMVLNVWIIRNGTFKGLYFTGRKLMLSSMCCHWDTVGHLNDPTVCRPVYITLK